MFRTILLALPFLAAVSTSTSAQMTSRGLPDLFASGDASAQYVERVAMTDMFKIETSKSALRRSPSPGIRRFAQQVLDEHGWLSAQLLQSLDGRPSPPPLPVKLDRPHKRLLAQLNAAPRAEFDRLYIRFQVKATEEVLAEHTRYAVTGPDGDLKLLAETAKPVIQTHLNELRALVPAQ